MKRVGFVGLGIMGSAMAGNILKKSGRELVVYDVDTTKLDELAALGAYRAASLQEVAATCDTIITMVPAAIHVRSVYQELLPVLRPETLCIDMSTIEPEVHREIYASFIQKNILMLDAPVVKSRAAAWEGTLGIYVGGTKEAYERALPLLSCMGNQIRYMGAAGSGMLMKICHNMLVATIQNGVHEMLVLANAGHISTADAIDAASIGGAQCFYMDTKKENLASGTYETAFSVRNMNKDVHIAKGMAEHDKLQLTALQHVCDLYEEAMLRMADLDFSSLYEIVKGRNRS